MRILIAEDDPKLLKSLVHIFELNHYATDGVDNGVDAFDYASSGEYDGLVLDVMMPGMDGVTLLKKLRAKGITTPALFLTARTEIDQRIEGLDAGADDYLPKPFSTGELLARVRAMLRQRRRRKRNPNTRVLFMCASTVEDTSIVNAGSSFIACVPNASMPEKQKISAITVTAPDSKKQISHNEKTRLHALVALACFVSPVEPPSIKP